MAAQIHYLSETNVIRSGKSHLAEREWQEGEGIIKREEGKREDDLHQGQTLGIGLTIFFFFFLSQWSRYHGHDVHFGPHSRASGRDPFRQRYGEGLLTVGGHLRSPAIHRRQRYSGTNQDEGG